MDPDNLTSEFTFAHRRFWLSLGWMLVLGVIYLSLTPAPIQVPVAEGDKLGHLLAYGTLMVWFSNLYNKGIRRVVLALCFVAMGIALEFVQGWTGFRTFEVADMAANASGVLIGWALAPPRTPNFLRCMERLPFVRKQNRR
jgi:VanZ family protein